MTNDRVDVQWARKVAGDGIKHWLNALVLKGRATENWGEFVGDGCAANSGDDLFFAQVRTLKVLLHDCVITLSESFEHREASGIRLLFEICWDLFDQVVIALLGFARPDQSLHRDQINNAAEVTLRSDWNLENQRLRIQTGDDHSDTHIKVGAGAIKLIYETDTRNLVAVSLAPDSL
ncbi:hypothetical protein GALL_494890 [mine drainage metagenome]|uniref:Uncharacterized protein n=1 Tax=mine drainage metagenome TaxID=410659 RepID=A0A1J5PMC4_9ZZZZ